MLSVTEDHENREKIYNWHVGEAMPKFEISKVVEVQADGHELEFIKFRFEVPYMCGKIIIWYGDFAKFIAGNLKHC